MSDEILDHELEAIIKNPSKITENGLRKLAYTIRCNREKIASLESIIYKIRNIVAANPDEDVMDAAKRIMADVQASIKTANRDLFDFNAVRGVIGARDGFPFFDELRVFVSLYHSEVSAKKALAEQVSSLKNKIDTAKRDLA